MTRTRDCPPFLLLVAAECLSFAPFIHHRGFYADDWIFLHNGFASEGIWDAMSRLAQGGFWARPVEILHYPLFYSLGLDHPLAAQALLLLLKVAEGWLLFKLLERLLGRSELALWAALLALVFPNRSATHLWFANSPQGVSLVLGLAALLLHESWLRTRDRRRLAGGLACYLVALLNYESIAFAPLGLGAALAARETAAGLPWRKACLRAARDLLPLGACLGAGLLWMWGGAALLSGQANPKPLQLSLASVLEVYAAGLACLTTRPLMLCVTTARTAARYLPAPGIFLWAAGILGVAHAAVGAKATPGDKSGPMKIAAAFAAAIFIGAYAPYGLSRHGYLPDVGGIMDRINGVGAWSAGLGLAALLALLPSAGLRRAALALLLGAFTWTNAFTSLQWAVAWETQRAVLAGVSRRARELPASAMVILAGAPLRIGGAPIFTESWDFDYALKLVSGRADLSGRVAGARLRFEKDCVAEAPGAAHWPTTEEWRYPYRDLFLYRHDKGTLETLDGPPREPHFGHYSAALK